MSNPDLPYPSGLNRFAINGANKPCNASVRVRYNHILVPLDPATGDSAAIALATLLAKSNQSDLTLLHVLPDAAHSPLENQPRGAMRGLDAIERLHYSLPLSGTANMLRQQSHALGIAQARLQTFAQQQFPDASLAVRTACRIGDPADAILTFCEEEHVDLIILSSQLSWWGVPVVPRDVRRVLKAAKQQVIVVRPKAEPELK